MNQSAAGSSPGIFVGRQEELRELQAAIGVAAGGHGTLAFIAGEPGIGKTALCEQVSQHARLLGAAVWVGHSYERTFSLPYGALVEALRDHVRFSDLNALKAQLAGGAAEVAVLVSEIRDRLDLKEQARSQAENDYNILYEALNGFLRRVGEGQLLLLVLEDLQWADQGTLDFLVHIARNLGDMRVVILGTYRDIEVDRSHPLSGALGDLRRITNLQRIGLRGLILREVHQMFEAARGEAVPYAEAERLHDQTEGNPLYVHELLRYLMESGLTIDAAGNYVSQGEVVTRVPEGLRDVIGRRLDHLSKTTNRVLSVASVIGREFRLDVLRHVTGLPEMELLEALEEATTRSLLEQHESPGVVVFRFSHAVFQTMLYEETFTPRRIHLHLAVGHALEAVFADQLQLHAGELAEHFSHSSDRADLTKALNYSQIAADRAMNMVAYGDAVRFVVRALEIQEVALPNDISLRSDLLLTRAKAFASLGRWGEARVDFESVLDEIEGESLAEVLLDLTSLCYWLNDTPSMRRYAQEASALAQSIGRDDLVTAATGFVAQSEAFDGRLTSSLRLYQKAIQKADLRLRTHRQAFDRFPNALYWSGQYEEAAAQSRGAVDAARAAGDMTGVITVLPTLGLSLAATGLYAAAEDLFSQARELGEEHRTTSLTARALGMSVGHHIDVFDFAGAEELAQEASDLARSVGFLYPEVSVGIDLLHIYLNRGDVGRVDILTKSLRERAFSGTGSHRVLWTLRLADAQAATQLYKGDWPGAIEWANDSLEQSRSLGRRKYESRALTTRGRALVKMGQVGNGLEDLRRSIQIARSLRDPALLLRATTSLLSIDADDSLIAEARETAGKIAAELPNERLREQFANAEPLRVLALNVNGPARFQHPDGLTEREVEVLRLIAGGSSNREVAAQLVLSLRTVERHITNIYAKIGARGRADATSYALRNSLS